MQEKYGDISGKNKHQIGSNCHGDMEREGNIMCGDGAFYLPEIFF